MSQNIQQHFKGNADHIDDETLAAFVENALDTKEQGLVKAHLRQCPQCVENMAVLRKSLSEREDMEFQATPLSFVREAKALGKPATSSEPFWQKLLDKINAIPLPAFKWQYAIPAVATVAILLAVVIINLGAQGIQNFSTGGYLVVSRIDPLGFVRKSDSLAYGGMKVELSADEKSIIFTWPEVEGAQFYHVTLILNGERPRITPLIGIRKTSFSYPAQEIKPNTEYIWEISGKLEDSRSFQAKAGFIWKK